MSKVQIAESEKRANAAEAAARQTEQTANQRLALARQEMENAVRRAEAAEEATREAKSDIAYLDKMIRISSSS